MTDAGTILRDESATADGRVTVIACSDHSSDRRRVLRIVVDGRDVTAEEWIGNPDSDVDEFVISEDLTTAAVRWNTSGVSLLDLLTLGEDQKVLVRRSVELPGMVASGLSITDDGELLSLTVESPNLPQTVEILRTSTGKIEPINVDRTRRIAERAQENYIPELVHFTARDGLEPSGWLYHGEGEDAAGPQPV